MNAVLSIKSHCLSDENQPLRSLPALVVLLSPVLFALEVFVPVPRFLGPSAFPALLFSVPLPLLAFYVPLLFWPFALWSLASLTKSLIIFLVQLFLSLRIIFKCLPWRRVWRRWLPFCVWLLQPSVPFLFSSSRFQRLGLFSSPRAVSTFQRPLHQDLL